MGWITPEIHLRIGRFPRGYPSKIPEQLDQTLKVSGLSPGTLPPGSHCPLPQVPQVPQRRQRPYPPARLNWSLPQVHQVPQRVALVILGYLREGDGWLGTVLGYLKEDKWELWFNWGGHKAQLYRYFCGCDVSHNYIPAYAKNVPVCNT